jgi:hypothetical protein
MQTRDEPERNENSAEARANPGYALGQVARALATSEGHPDEATRARAAHKAQRWVAVFQGMVSGALNVGARTPVAGTPPWATLEVLRGGFATGHLLAEGPLQAHEEALLRALPTIPAGGERAALNSYYLSDAGLAALQTLLGNGRYRIAVPEEGALLVVAWLVRQGHAPEARDVLDALGPWLGRLRFYPLPSERPLEVSAAVFRQDVAQTAADLRRVQVRPSLAREREALLVWAPLYDRAVALFGATVAGEQPFVPLNADGQPLRKANGYFQVAGGWPCQHYPADWAVRARALLDDYQRQRAEHRLVAKPERLSESFALLRGYLARCISEPQGLTGREVGQIRSLLANFALRRSVPGTPQHQALRAAQRQRATAPTTTDVAQMLLARLAVLPQDEGLPDLAAVAGPVTTQEAHAFGLVAAQPLPPTLTRKLERSRVAPLAELIERRLLPSSEAVARVVPQLSAYARVAAINDPDLQRLYSALYTAFRRRRSLLLLNLKHQVQFDELPWVMMLELYRTDSERSQQVARALLSEVVALTLTTFPQHILPNTLLREVRALAASAGLKLPIVDEVAADIFMGTFSEKYLRAAQWAARVLEGTLYERYYGLPYAQVQQIDDVTPSRYGTATSPAFVRLCHQLAGVSATGVGWSVAHNGTIIEQEQILTTHNLAVLFDALGLSEALRPQLGELVRRCFVWICATLQQERGRWKATMRAIKNSAYAWRQMVFFLALLPPDEVATLLDWAEAHLAAQPAPFAERLRPALDGLRAAAMGAPVARRFLGWATAQHWLLAHHSVQRS